MHCWGWWERMLRCLWLCLFSSSSMLCPSCSVGGALGSWRSRRPSLTPPSLPSATRSHLRHEQTTSLRRASPEGAHPGLIAAKGLHVYAYGLDKCSCPKKLLMMFPCVDDVSLSCTVIKCVYDTRSPAWNIFLEVSKEVCIPELWTILCKLVSACLPQYFFIPKLQQSYLSKKNTYMYQHVLSQWLGIELLLNVKV